MKQIAPIVFVTLTLALSSCVKEDTTGKSLTILTEVMKPFNYQENGVQKGITMDLVRQIMNEQNLDNEVIILNDWDSVYKRLQTEENIMAFTTGYIADRKGLFQWVGPVAVWRTAFVALKSANLTLSYYSDAKELASVGVVTSSFGHETLTNLGFTNLIYYDNVSTLTRALYDGTITVAFEPYDLLRMAAQDESQDPSKLENLYTYSSTPAYLAFSKDVSSKLIKNWQEALDQRKDDGSLQELYDTYLPGTIAPGRILMFAEENPPQNFLDEDGNLTGSSVDMVKAMTNGTNLTGPIEYTNWTDAYNNLLMVPNTMVFSTVRTESRENLFQWIGPVCKKRYCFYVPSWSEFHIITLNDARTLHKVGTVTGWASEKELLDLDFENVVTFATPQEVFEKLMSEEITCAVLNDISMTSLAAEAAHSPKDYRQEAVLSEGQTYLAFSINTDPEYITRWKNAYNTLVSSGKFSEIWKVWYPDIDW